MNRTYIKIIFFWDEIRFTEKKDEYIYPFALFIWVLVYISIIFGEKQKIIMDKYAQRLTDWGDA